MKRILPCLLAVLALQPSFRAATPPVGGNPADVVCYVGPGADTTLDSVFQLSDGSLLVGGGSTSLSWLPQGTRVVTLAAPGLGTSSGKTAFLLHLAPDGKRVLEAYALPQGAALDIATIKTTSAPGQPTGAVFIAGRVKKDPANGLKGDGYFIGRLDGNFAAKPVTKLLWTFPVWSGGAMREHRLPWDVGPDGTVVYATGVPYAYDWCGIEALDANGERKVMPGWRRHWVDNGGGATEVAGTLDEAAKEGKPLYSGIVLKKGGRGDFRSWTEADWRAQVPDGNGGFNQGQWPFDAMFPGPFDPSTGDTLKLKEDGRGWYGYKWGRNPTACVGAIVVDRRDGGIYVGGNNQSNLPNGGLPDFEPWVVAMDKTGAKKWWSRLYPESKGVSTPDQYVDGMAIDYTVPVGTDKGVLVVLARCHGNNVNNLWNGSKIQKGSGKTFQAQFSGTNGNAHYGWIGRMTLSDGTMLAATFVGERNEGVTSGKPYSNPLLSHWPDYSGWPNLNTTKIHSLAIDGDGRAFITATGRRVITTKNAFQSMPSPLADPGKFGTWSDFVRVYTKDLSDLRYSSILNGQWDWAEEKNKNNSKVELVDAIPVKGGVLVVGKAPADKDGTVKGNDMPTRNVPAWGAARHTAPAGVFAFLRFQ